MKTKQDILEYQRRRQLELNSNYINEDRNIKNSINNIIKTELKLYIPNHVSLYKKYSNIKGFIISKILTQKGKFTAERNNYVYFLKNDYLVEYGHIYFLTNFLPKDTNLTVRLIYILEDLTEIKKCQFCGKDITNVRMNCSINCKERRGDDKEETIRKNKVVPDVNKTLYQKECRKLTEICYKENKNIINPNNYSRGRAGTENSYHLDHIISVEFGYLYNIPSSLIADITNLQLIPWEENCKKNKYIDKQLKIRLNEILLEETLEKSEGKGLTFLIIELLKEFNKNKNLRKKIINTYNTTY